MGCLINYLITLSTVFKLPQTPRKRGRNSIRSFNGDFCFFWIFLILLWVQHQLSALVSLVAQLWSSLLLCLRERQDRRCYLHSLLYSNFHRIRKERGENRLISSTPPALIYTHTHTRIAEQKQKQFNTISSPRARVRACVHACMRSSRGTKPISVF